jgi:protein-S-isoprenylcysteine O-methyltransferase Ste14
MMGLVLTMAGCGFAAWARLALGSNWSGTATIKENHELVVKGPYRLARHPIYSGILIACLGTTLAIGEWRCIVGLIVVSLGLALKVTQEERLMVATFPEAYPLYRRRVKALIPGLL